MCKLPKAWAHQTLLPPKTEIWQPNAAVNKDLVMPCVVKTIPQITRAVLSTTSYKKKKQTHQSERNTTLLSHKSNVPYILNHKLPNSKAFKLASDLYQLDDRRW
jgi:hypothetical protein